MRNGIVPLLLVLAMGSRVSVGGDGAFPLHMHGPLIDIMSIETKGVPVEVHVGPLGGPNEKLPCALPEKREASGMVKAGPFGYEVKGVCLAPEGRVQIIAVQPLGPDFVKHVWVMGRLSNDGRHLHGGVVIGTLNRPPSYEIRLNSK